MIRPMTSNVAALSGIVANGHQAIHFVSSAPSKIPYGGFSPVRLQASLSVATFTWVPRLIRHLIASLISGVIPWQSSKASVQPLARTGPMALGSPVGCIVPQDLHLLWPYPRLCWPPSGLIDYVHLALRSRASSQRVPNLLCQSFATCRLPYSGGSSRCT